jgi:L-serine dehydratase
MKSDERDELLPLEGTRPTSTEGVDRRALTMRTAPIGATAVLTGCSPAQRTAYHHRAAAAAQGSSPDDLNVVKKSKAPVITTLDEFYKVGLVHRFAAHHRADAHHLRLYQRATNFPPINRAGYGSRCTMAAPATGKGHGTEPVGRVAARRQFRAPGQPADQQITVAMEAVATRATLGRIDDAQRAAQTRR